MPSAFEDLPFEIHYKIVCETIFSAQLTDVKHLEWDWFRNQKEISELALVNTTWRSIVQGIIFRDVTVFGSKMHRFVAIVNENPTLLTFLRTIDVRYDFTDNTVGILEKQCTELVSSIWLLLCARGKAQGGSRSSSLPLSVLLTTTYRFGTVTYTGHSVGQIRPSINLPDCSHVSRFAMDFSRRFLRTRPQNTFIIDTHICDVVRNFQGVEKVVIEWMTASGPVTPRQESYEEMVKSISLWPSTITWLDLTFFGKYPDKDIDLQLNSPYAKTSTGDLLCRVLRNFSKQLKVCKLTDLYISKELFVPRDCESRDEKDDRGWPYLHTLEIRFLHVDSYGSLWWNAVGSLSKMKKVLTLEERLTKRKKLDELCMAAGESLGKMPALKKLLLVGVLPVRCPYNFANIEFREANGRPRLSISRRCYTPSPGVIELWKKRWEPLDLTVY